MMIDWSMFGTSFKSLASIRFKVIISIVPIRAKVMDVSYRLAVSGCINEQEKFGIRAEIVRNLSLIWMVGQCLKRYQLMCQEMRLICLS